MNEPTSQDANIYMEICASLMTHFGISEIEIDMASVPNRPFQIWRRVENDKLSVRLIWEDTTKN